jgi:hypothetical protein
LLAADSGRPTAGVFVAFARTFCTPTNQKFDHTLTSTHDKCDAFEVEKERAGTVSPASPQG